VAAELRKRDGVMPADVASGVQVHVLRRLIQIATAPTTIKLAAGEYSLEGVPLVIDQFGLKLCGPSPGAVCFVGGERVADSASDDMIVANEVDLHLENIDFRYHFAQSGSSFRGCVRAMPRESALQVLTLMHCKMEMSVIANRSVIKALDCNFDFVYTEGDCVFQRCTFENTLHLNPVIQKNYSVLLDDCNLAGQRAILKIGTVMDDATTFIIRDSSIRELQLRNAVRGGVLVFENLTKECVVLHAKLDPQAYPQRSVILVNVPAHTLITEIPEAVPGLLSDSDLEEDDDMLFPFNS
jgi:hypothetical protein